MMKKIIVAKNIGFCYGVKRAINLAEKIVNETTEKVYTLGPIIHNPQVVQKLEKRGLNVINDINEITNGTLILRSHGITIQQLNLIKEKKINVIDATCPFVKRAQNLVQELKNDGYNIIIFGEKEHPEIQSLLSYAGEDAIVVEEISDIKKIPGTVKKAGVISQTTQSKEKLKKFISKLSKKIKNLKVCNTICAETIKRQKEAVSIARKVDLMFVIGGKNSANTTRLAQICKRVNRNTYHIETSEELDFNLLRNRSKIGIISGASTPDNVIDDVIDKIKSFIYINKQLSNIFK